MGMRYFRTMLHVLPGPEVCEYLSDVMVSTKSFAVRGGLEPQLVRVSLLNCGDYFLWCCRSVVNIYVIFYGDICSLFGSE